MPPRLADFFADRLALVLRFGAFFFGFLAAERRFGAADLFFALAARAGFRALAETFLPFFGAALRGAFFAIAFSLTKGL